MILFFIQVATKNRIVGYILPYTVLLYQSCGLYCRAVCITRSFSEPQNPRFIIENGYNSARLVHIMIIYLFSLFYLFQTVWCLTIYLAFGLGSARHHHYRRGGETIQNANEHGKYYINVAIRIHVY